MKSTPSTVYTTIHFGYAKERLFVEQSKLADIEFERDYMQYEW